MEGGEDQETKKTAKTVAKSDVAVSDAAAMEARVAALEAMVAGLKKDVIDITAEVEDLTTVVLDTRNVGQVNTDVLQQETGDLREAVGEIVGTLQERLLPQGSSAAATTFGTLTSKFAGDLLADIIDGDSSPPPNGRATTAAGPRNYNRFQSQVAATNKRSAKGGVRGKSCGGAGTDKQAAEEEEMPVFLLPPIANVPQSKTKKTRPTSNKGTSQASFPTSSALSFLPGNTDAFSYNDDDDDDDFDSDDSNDDDGY